MLTDDEIDRQKIQKGPDAVIHKPTTVTLEMMYLRDKSFFIVFPYVIARISSQETARIGGVVQEILTI